MMASTENNCDYPTRTIDLRSDTLTVPSKAMKEAMMIAPVGDDVWGEDPTVIALQEKVSKLLGKEAALFVPTGTMGNLICVLAHCGSRGSEVILGDKCHIQLYEQGGISQLGGVHPRAIPNLPDGTFSLDALRKLVRADDQHFPVTELVCVENTHNVAGGRVIPMEWLDQLGALCKELGLPLHMDGARIMNAATYLNLPASRVVRDCTTVSLCLSKGLGAPVGSVIAGPSEFIRRAHRLRKALGGGMRQSGIIAAAGIYALDHAATTLAKDHAHIKTIATEIIQSGLDSITVNLEGVHTNIILLECNLNKITPAQLANRMGQVTNEEMEFVGEKVIAKMAPMTVTAVRMVMHCDIKDDDILPLIKKIKYVMKEIM